MPLNFAATTQKVQLPDSINTVRNVPGATLCGWVNLTSKTALQTLFSLTINTGRTFSRCGIYAVATDTIHIRASGRALDADTAADFITAGLSVTAGVWSFIASTFDYINRRMQIFLNTASELSPLLTGWTSGNCSNTPTLANTLGNKDDSFANYPLIGSAEDLRIYNRVLSSAELETIYNCKGSDAIYYGLTGRFLMSEKENGFICVGGEIVKDYAGRYDGAAVVGSTYTEGFIKKSRLIH
jgi:hypothetical protein